MKARTRLGGSDFNESAVIPILPIMTSPSGDVAGWLYLNLSNSGAPIYSAARGGFRPPTSFARQSQNWAIISMFAEGRYSVDFDATSLGNGCSPAPGPSSTQKIGPSGGVPVCPPLVACTPGTSYTGTNVTP
ncbi:MAG TPA: hypothetical protein VEZ11_09780 [Thermoanaerobaculia bacterium]|nr:hypothetical protein [Thermoanaerobaculia bacterium]